jgi:hypothetical protein
VFERGHVNDALQRLHREVGPIVTHVLLPEVAGVPDDAHSSLSYRHSRPQVNQVPDPDLHAVGRELSQEAIDEVDPAVEFFDCRPPLAAEDRKLSGFGYEPDGLSGLGVGPQ